MKYAVINNALVTNYITADPSYLDRLKQLYPDCEIIPSENIGKGYYYDVDEKKFIDPQPYSSWYLNDKKQWTAPKPKPDDGKEYFWNKDTNDWISKEDLIIKWEKDRKPIVIKNAVK